MARVLHTRAVATVVACALSLYATGAFPQLAAPELSCCCHHHSDDCHCKACTHARAVASGRPLVESCGSGPVNAVPVPSQVFLPPACAQQQPQPPRVGVDAAPVPQRLEPVSEVPTPPPLARS